MKAPKPCSEKALINWAPEIWEVVNRKMARERAGLDPEILRRASTIPISVEDSLPPGEQDSRESEATLDLDQGTTITSNTTESDADQSLSKIRIDNADLILRDPAMLDMVTEGLTKDEMGCMLL